MTNLTMFVMKILQEIVVHFSFDMIRIFASFSGHILFVEVQRHRHLKLPKISDIWLLHRQKFGVVFIAREIISTRSNFE